MKKLLFFISAVALLASCSKDTTEDVVVAPKGNSKIIASVVMDAETRVHLEKVGTDYRYFFDKGDGVGLFGVTKDGNDDTNAYFGYTGEGDAFTGEYRLLDAEAYYGYYPYSSEKKVENNTIKLNIKAKQNYSFSNTTFAAGVAPVVGYGETMEEGMLPMAFKPVATYLCIPVYGYGKARTVSLEITKSTSEKVQLSGEVTVTLSNLKDLASTANIALDDVVLTEDPGATKVTLNCGSGVDVSADPKNPTLFWFVVPAGVEWDANAIATVTINGEVLSPRTFAKTVAKRDVNKAATIWATDTNGEAFKWVEGGAYLITNEYEFLMYAYAATKGYDETAPAGLFEASSPNALKKAMIVNNLDFTAENTDFETDPRLSQLEGYGDYLVNVLDAYNKDGVKTLTPDVNRVYDIVGNLNGEGKAVELKGLKVAKGNAIFAGNAATKPSVSNITVTDAVVDNAYIFVSNYNTAMFNTFENITVNGTYEDAAAVNYTYTSMLQLPKQPLTCGEGVKFANSLYVNKSVVLGTQYASANGLAFDVVYAHNVDGPIVTVADADAAASLIAAIKPNNNVPKGWFSVVTCDEEDAVETSYWTGFTATKVVESDAYTAEELAYDVVNVSADKTITLTNDINLMGNAGKLWVEGVSQPIPDRRLTVKGAEHTISNVVIADAEDATEFRTYYTLFGGGATVQNLTVDGITIAVAKEATAPVVAALAGSAGVGTCQNVAVKGLQITVPEGANVEFVGGLYASATKSYLDRIAKNNTMTVESPEYNIPESVVCGDIIGQVTLTVSGANNDVYEHKAASEHPFGAVVINVADQTKSESTKITFTNLVKSQVPQPVFGERQEKGHIIMIYFGEDSNYGYFLRDEVQE